MFTNIVPASKMFNRIVGGLSIIKKSFGSMILSNAPLYTNATICPTKHTFNFGYSFAECKYCSHVANSNETASSQKIPYHNPNTTMEELDAMLKADPEKHKRYKIIQLEVEILRQNGAFLPEKIKPYRWLELLDLKSITARRRLLNFLSIVEAKQQHRKEKRQKAKIIRDETKQNEMLDNDDTSYKLYKNSMFLRIYESTMNHYYNGRLFQAMQYNPKIVIDCSYHTAMTLRENYECGKQLSLLFACNRSHPDPFDLHFCNVDKSSAMMKKFIRIIPTAYDTSFPLNVHEKSYTELFDKQNLVYLSPHCNTLMTEYDASSVYIIGAMVDKSNSEPISLAKAKKDGLKMAKLPFEKYLLWGTGASKRLPLNQILSILLDLKLTGDWEKAFSHVPRRKLERNTTDAFTESQLNVRNAKYNNHNRQQASTTSEYTNHDAFSFEARQKKQLYK